MTVAASLLTAEILHCDGQSQRAKLVLGALTRAAAAAGVRAQTSQDFTGGSDWLLLWGPGAPNRVAPMRAQLEAGGRVIVFDLAYWDRHEKFRVSIDAPHPQAWVMRQSRPETRLRADGVRLEQTWNRHGPVIVAGIGAKANVQYGADTVRAWEEAQIALARAGGRRVLYRPKRDDGRIAPGVSPAPSGPIDMILRGASAVITWHSNVAADAIRLGIPAVCRDGAAAAVCDSTWSPGIAPLHPARQRDFLANLAWFQWAPSEARGCWAFLKDVLACAS
jgi:hypothetical protein